MLYDVPAAIKAISEAFNKFFDMKKTSIEHQAETVIIDENENQIKAIKLADEILDLVLESNGYLTDKQLKTIKKLKQKFDKYKNA